MADVKDFTGAINVLDGDVTPVTRQKIDKVTPEKWHQMDINMLWDQRITLNNRMIMALQSGHAEIAKQVQAGINTIDAILQHKAAQEPTDKSGLI